MGEISETNRFQGRVAKILSYKRAGFISPDDKNERLYFVASEVKNDKFDTMKQGDIVTFTIGKGKEGTLLFANQVELIIEGEHRYSATQTRFHGHVKIIFTNKRSGYITLDGSTKDLYFIAKEVEDNKVETLKVGDAVTFTIGESEDGRRFANRIQLIDVDPIDQNEAPAELLPSPITCDELKHQIIEQFKRIVHTTSSSEFEDLTFLLLKNLGIHYLYQYDKRNQAGRADGFFIIGNLAVMYDCTLRDGFEEYKKDQIENYINKLEQAQLTFNIRASDGVQKKKTLRIDGKSKQVWIITLGQTREISDYGNIKVKEVSINHLIWLLQERLNRDVIEEDDLALNLLSRIEKVIPA
ncbi:Cold-shock protein DNA-binding protein [Oscillatoria nigro-viridis PCC 7112]|uniref:Cold-shock protein DNA-binding protein n=1 Tax=Phormidium nigroviride PCC 7112 TaxID=179408 RepID=K9VPB2_9CYAN|nr:cold shock domain-containing protein [Oscillatoria nigro-viridis]AFZ09337.1 Cold-shock protein DNA-binding protein [Oscillatoria nigro-viridis PCC 7112]